MKKKSTSVRKSKKESKPKLPKKLTLPMDLDDDPAYDGADILSDEVGFCVEGFDFRVIKKTEESQIVEFYDIDWDTSE